ncbi:hypothetical protein GJ496_007425 [Pomphorhynchus laevis]|nr:hypothetical protein GJ496_007425 [Pomphorhynchus laevis]
MDAYVVDVVKSISMRALGYHINCSSISSGIDSEVITGCSKGDLVVWKHDCNQRSYLLTNYHRKEIKCIHVKQHLYHNSLLCSADDEGQLIIWRYERSRKIKLLHKRRCVGGSVNSLDLCHEGTFIVVSGSEKSIKIRYIEDLKFVSSYVGHHNSVSSVRYSPNCNSFASASLDNTVKLWDVRIPKHVKDHKFSNCRYIAWSANEQCIFVACSDGTISKWNLQANKLELSIKYSSVKLNGIEIIKNSNPSLITCTSSNGLVYIIDCNKLNLIKSINDAEPQSSIKFCTQSNNQAEQRLTEFNSCAINGKNAFKTLRASGLLYSKQINMTRRKFRMITLVVLILLMTNLIIFNSKAIVNVLLYITVSIISYINATYFYSAFNNSSPICVIITLFASIGKQIFVADPNWKGDNKSINFKYKQNVILGVLIQDNEIGLDKIEHIDKVKFPNIYIKPMPCIGRHLHTIGAVYIQIHQIRFYIHFFNRIGDYYKICNVNLSNKFPFGDVDRSMDEFDLTLKHFKTHCDIIVPADSQQFNFNYQSSQFIECNRTSMDWIYSKYPEQKASELFLQSKILSGLKAMKHRSNSMRKHLFMFAGTLLGWYRQCGIIQSSHDVDFAMLDSEYDDSVFKSFLGGKDMYVWQTIGMDNNESKEMRLYDDKYSFDLFVLKLDPIRNVLLSTFLAELSLYRRRSPPINKICSAEMAGIRLLVPCNAYELIQYEYGPYPEWQIPTSDGGWKSMIYEKWKLNSWSLQTISERYNAMQLILADTVFEWNQ